MLVGQSVGRYVGLLTTPRHSLNAHREERALLMEKYSDLADGTIAKNRAGECLWYQIMHAHDDHEVRLTLP